MKQVQLHKAKANLSALVERAALGETFLITRRNQPQAVIIGIDEWNRLHNIPSFGHLIAASGLEGADVPLQNPRPLGSDEF